MSKYTWVQAGGKNSTGFAYEWAYRGSSPIGDNITGISRCMFCKRFLPVECRNYDEYGNNCEDQDEASSCHHLSCKNEICQVKAALSGRSWC